MAKNIVIFSDGTMGIVFGAVHALTPGHSKAVLAIYLTGLDRHRPARPWWCRLRCPSRM